jgi:hypothetical protein
MKKRILNFIIIVIVVSSFLLCKGQNSKKTYNIQPGKIVKFERGVNVRAEHTFKSKIINQLRPSIGYEIIEYKILDIFGDWVNIIKDEGSNNYIGGWVWEGFVDEDVLIGNAFIRELPQKDGKILGKISPKDNYVIYGPYTTWIKIEHKDITGWVYFDRERATITNRTIKK